MKTNKLLADLYNNTGITISKNGLYYYESQGVLKSNRTKNKYRDWEEKEIPKIKFILQLTDLGISTDKIKSLLQNSRKEKVFTLLIKKRNHVNDCLNYLKYNF